jgi:putative ABC transport system permease protein
VPLASLTFAALTLRTFTGQTSDPSMVVPWWLLGVVAVSLFTALAVQVAAEAAVRRRARLGDVLRAGDS